MGGTGQRLDGKATRQKEFKPVVQGGMKSEEEKKQAMREARAAAAMARFKPGKLSFSFNSAAAAQQQSATKPAADDMATGTNGGSGAATGGAEKDEAKGFVAFGGQGHTLR